MKSISLRDASIPCSPSLPCCVCLFSQVWDKERKGDPLCSQTSQSEGPHVSGCRDWTLPLPEYFHSTLAAPKLWTKSNLSPRKAGPFPMHNCQNCDLHSSLAAYEEKLLIRHTPCWKWNGFYHIYLLNPFYLQSLQVIPDIIYTRETWSFFLFSWDSFLCSFAQFCCFSWTAGEC